MDPRTLYLLQKCFKIYKKNMKTFYKHITFCKLGNLNLKFVKTMCQPFETNKTDKKTKTCNTE